MLYALIITDLCCSCEHIQINSVMLIYSGNVKPCKTAGFLQHKLKTDTINKNVVSLSWLNVKKNPRYKTRLHTAGRVFNFFEGS